MATIKNIQDKKSSDHTTGMLGLAADRSMVGGKCLTSEQMAVLVEGQCANQEEQEFLKHIACCDTCYGEWLILSELFENKVAGKKGKIRSLISSPKVLAVCGSALAAAASIAFVLNIQFDRQQLSPMKVEETVLEMKKEESGAETKELKKPDIEQPRQQPAVVMKVELLKESSPKPDVVEREIKERLMTVREKSSSAASWKRPKRQIIAGKVASDEVAFSQAKSGKPTIDNWLQQVESGCVDNQQDVLFWDRLVRDGKLLRTQNSTQMQENAQFVNVLNFVMEMEVENRDRMCTEILRILEDKEVPINQEWK